MIIAGIDIETTGLDPNNSEIIEIGYALWDIELDNFISCNSFLVKPKKLLPDKILDLTGICQLMIDWHADHTRESAIEAFKKDIKDVNYLMAHNASFEKSFLPELSGYKWIDSKTDIPYKKALGKGTLTHIAANHGFLNPFPHRALFDVMTMFKIASLYDWDEIIERSESKTFLIKAVVDFKDKDLAKEAGFYWDAERKSWLREIKECDLFEFTGQLSFNFKVLD